jgi:hypothetical protein
VNAPGVVVRGLVVACAFLSACGTKSVSGARSVDPGQFAFKIDRDGSFQPDADWFLFHNARIPTRGMPVIVSGVGIAINAPRTVEFSYDDSKDYSGDPPRLSQTHAKFIVCVATQFVYDTLGYGKDFMDNVVLVVTDPETHKEHLASASAAEDSDFRENLEPPPDDVPRPRIDRTAIIPETLRADIGRMMHDLPAVEGDYLVRAKMGTYVSNTLTVKLVRRPVGP